MLKIRYTKIKYVALYNVICNYIYKLLLNLVKKQYSLKKNNFKVVHRFYKSNTYARVC